MHLLKIKCKLKGVKIYVTNVFMYFYSNQLFLYSTEPVYFYRDERVKFIQLIVEIILFVLDCFFKYLFYFGVISKF